MLDDPGALDAALTSWAQRRERECFEIYQWTDRLARGEAMTPLEVELYRRAEHDPELAGRFLEVFSRQRAPSELVTPARAAALAFSALARGEHRLRDVLAALRDEVVTSVTDRRERGRATPSRRTRRLRPGWTTTLPSRAQDVAPRQSSTSPT